jgi:hypothetical protein
VVSHHDELFLLIPRSLLRGGCIHDAGGTVTFRGHYAAITEQEALDINVLGREITGLFAVIVDRPGQVVALLGQRHQYIIVQT